MENERGELVDNSIKHARFLALLEPVLAKLSRYCHALTKDVEDGQDLLSDAILLVYENFEKLRAPEAFASYAFTTARRLYYRRARRKKWWGVFGAEARTVADDRSTAPEMNVDTGLLDRALSQLPEKQREAVILFEISGLSLQEIVQIQGGSLSGVKSRIVRGRDKLRELLLDGESLPTVANRSNAMLDTSFHSVAPVFLMRKKA